MRGVFLDKVQPFDRDFLLVGPATAKVALRADKDAARVGVDEQFGQVGLRQPLAIAINDGVNVCRFAVEDQGIGVDPHLRERAFEVFRLLNRPGAYEGTGVGLAIARSIVQAYRGRIWMEDTDTGKGVRVCFTLPAAA